MKRTQLAFAIFLVSVMVFPSQALLAQKSFDSEAMGLGMPQITINQNSGPPGTKVEINISSPVPIPKNIDPRTEFFIFLPFLTEIGSNVPHNCQKQYCIPVYSFEEIGSGKIGPKTITFTLFSTSNPKPTVQGGWLESICDLKINGKTIERYGNTCFEKNQPVGDYQIKFGWGIQRTDVYDIRKTIVFTVTEKGTAEKTPATTTETKTESEKELETTGEDEVLELGSPQETAQTTETGGGCLIATAAFGSELAPQVQLLREIRDNTVMSTVSGASFMTAFNHIYYSFSPTISDWERQSPAFKEAVKVSITPMIMSLSILNHVDVDSEQEMLGYGIGIILMNVGMYFVAPAMVLKKLTSKNYLMIIKKFELINKVLTE